MRRTTFMPIPLSSNGPIDAVPPLDLSPPPIWGTLYANMVVERGTYKHANAATKDAVGDPYHTCCRCLTGSLRLGLG